MYIFMLSAIIVMSGCFGSGSTDGQGVAPDDGDGGTDGSGTNGSGTTVVNHYHNTTTIVEEPPLMLFSGSISTIAGNNPQSVGNISINSNQTLEIVSSWASQNLSGNNGYGASVNIIPDCFNIGQINVRSDNHQATELPLFMPTNGNSCNYEMKIGYNSGTNPYPIQTISWSILYRVHQLG